MPKGEVLGPFYRPPKPEKFAQQDGLSCLIKRMWEDEPVLVLRHHLDEAECEELVALLNKGTHYERLLEALKQINLTFDSYGKERLPGYVRQELAWMNGAITAAEVKSE